MITPTVAAFIKQASILGLTCTAVGVTTYKAHEPIKKQVQKFTGHKKPVQKIKRKSARKSSSYAPPCPVVFSSNPIQVPVQDIWMSNFVLPPVNTTDNKLVGLPSIIHNNQFYGGSSGNSSSGGSSGVSTSSSSSSSSGGGSSGGSIPTVPPLPETGTWLMMLSGFAITGMTIRYKINKKYITNQ